MSSSSVQPGQLWMAVGTVTGSELLVLTLDQETADGFTLCATLESPWASPVGHIHPYPLTSNPVWKRLT